MRDTAVDRRRRASLRVYFSGLELTYDDEESVARGNGIVCIRSKIGTRLDFFFQNFIFRKRIF